MNKICLVIFFGSIILGCSSYVTQQELNTTRTQLQEVTAAAALAVHECASTRAYALRAAQYCQAARRQGFQTPICVFAQTWEQYCIPMERVNGIFVMVNPRPGVFEVLESLQSVYTRRARSGTNTASPSTLPAGQAFETPTILQEEVIERPLER